jgi:hypothetical protein
VAGHWEARWYAALTDVARINDDDNTVDLAVCLDDIDDA